MEDGRPRLRELPSVDEVLARPAVRALAARLGRTVAKVAAQKAIAAARERILAGAAPSGELVPDGEVLERARRETAPRLVRVLNATGVVLHTNLGRAPLHEEAIARVVEVASGYSNLEIDLRTGRREADLTFTSFGNERLAIDAKESDQALFEYKLGPDPDVSGRRNLFRRVKPILDEDADRGGQTAVLAEDVVAFSIEAWDARDRTWRAEWDSNSPQQSGQLLIPPRVKISLTVKDEQGKEKTWSTQAGIVLNQPLDF